MKKERLIEWGVNSETADIVLKEFNELLEANKQLKTDLSERNKQLDELRKINNNSDELKKQIANLQAQNEAAKNQFDKDMKKLKIDNAVKTALNSAKAKNSAIVMPLLAKFLENAEIDENGAIKGLDKEIDKLLKDESSSFLFEKDIQQKFSGLTPAETPKSECNISKGAGFAQIYNSQFSSAKQ